MMFIYSSHTRTPAQAAGLGLVVAAGWRSWGARLKVPLVTGQQARALVRSGGA